MVRLRSVDLRWRSSCHEEGLPRIRHRYRFLNLPAYAPCPRIRSFRDTLSSDGSTDAKTALLNIPPTMIASFVSLVLIYARRKDRPSLGVDFEANCRREAAIERRGRTARHRLWGEWKIWRDVGGEDDKTGSFPERIALLRHPRHSFPILLSTRPGTRIKRWKKDGRTGGGKEVLRSTGGTVNASSLWPSR